MALEQSSLLDGEVVEHVCAKFHFVDLAGKSHQPVHQPMGLAMVAMVANLSLAFAVPRAGPVPCRAATAGDHSRCTDSINCANRSVTVRCSEPVHCFAAATARTTQWRQAAAAGGQAGRSEYTLCTVARATAGSERVKRTQSSGTVLKEGIAINSGLLALGNVRASCAHSAAVHSDHSSSRGRQCTAARRCCTLWRLGPSLLLAALSIMGSYALSRNRSGQRRTALRRQCIGAQCSRAAIAASARRSLLVRLWFPLAHTGDLGTCRRAQARAARAVPRLKAHAAAAGE